MRNPALAVDGGMLVCSNIEGDRPAATEERRYCDTRLCVQMRTHE
jgi:hypothetical protein